MIRNRTLACFLLGTLATAALPQHARAQAAAPAADENVQARTLFRQGAAAMKDGKYTEARKSLLEAWSLRRSYDVAAVLGQAELELKLYRDAAEHLDFALNNLAPRESAETLEKIKSGLQSAKQQVAELRVSVNERNAAISIDGRDVGTSPLPNSIFVVTGPHTVEARLEPDRLATQSVQTAGGSAYTIELAVPAHPPAAPSSGLTAAAPPVAPMEQTPADSRSLVPVFIGGGVTLAGAVVGVAYHLAASSSKDELDTLKSKNGTDGCSSGEAAAADCDLQRSLADRVDTRRNLSTTGFVIAGAAAIATGVYWFWPRSSTNASARASHFFVSGAPAPGGGSVVVSGSF
jgi:hypothetical protein